jgi:hypothetical protein
MRWLTMQLSLTAAILNLNHTLNPSGLESKIKMMIKSKRGNE